MTPYMMFEARIQVNGMSAELRERERGPEYYFQGAELILFSGGLSKEKKSQLKKFNLTWNVVNKRNLN